MDSVVIGGSSSIGLPIVQALANAGHGVTATYNSSPPPKNDSVKWVRLDIMSRESIDSFGDECPSTDLLVLLPSLSLGKKLEAYTDELIDEVVTVNFSGQVRLLQAVKNHLTRGSQVIVMASIAAQRGSSDPLYGATKGAMISLTKSLAKSLAPTTRVNAIAPGMVRDTAMHDSTPKSIIDGHLAQTPTGHFPSAEDIAGIVVDMTRSHWSSLNGACIDLNGRQYLR